MDKKKLILWSMYDFANSIVLIVFFLYYSQWLVVEKGVSDFWFNITFVGSSILFLLTAPVVGGITDKLKVRLTGLRVTTFFSVIFFTATGLIAVFYPDHYIWSIVTFMLATYFYLFCFNFYNPMLEEVAPAEQRGLASGWGQFGNWLGQIFGLLVTLPLATGAIILVGESQRAQVLLPAAFLFLLFALPLLLFFEEKQKRQAVKINIVSEYKNVLRSARELVKAPGLGRFFLAYFFFNDAVITASNNYPIYLQKVFGVNDQVKSFILIGILVASVIGAPLSGWISDRFGHKRTLLWILGGWVVIFPAFALIASLYWFIVLSVIMGVWFGAIWTVTRAALMQLTPPAMLNRSFAYYTLMERFATLIGPLSWSLIIAYWQPAVGGGNYRLAVAVMGVFVLLGLLIARKLPRQLNSHISTRVGHSIGVD